MAKEKVKAKRSSADKAINAVIAVVMVAMIALASFALYSKFSPKDKVKDFADQMGMAVEDFQKEYGLENVSPDTKMEEAYMEMTIENALKFEGASFDEFMASGQLPETVTPDMKMSEVQKIMEEMIADTESEEGEEGEEAHAEGEAAPAE